MAGYAATAERLARGVWLVRFHRLPFFRLGHPYVAACNVVRARRWFRRPAAVVKGMVARHGGYGEFAELVAAGEVLLRAMGFGSMRFERNGAWHEREL